MAHFHGEELCLRVAPEDVQSTKGEFFYACKDGKFYEKYYIKGYLNCFVIISTLFIIKFLFCIVLEYISNVMREDNVKELKSLVDAIQNASTNKVSSEKLAQKRKALMDSEFFFKPTDLEMENLVEPMMERLMWDELKGECDICNDDYADYAVEDSFEDSCMKIYEDKKKSLGNNELFELNSLKELATMITKNEAATVCGEIKIFIIGCESIESYLVLISRVYEALQKPLRIIVIEHSTVRVELGNEVLKGIRLPSALRIEIKLEDFVVNFTNETSNFVFCFCSSSVTSYLVLTCIK